MVITISSKPLCPLCIVTAIESLITWDWVFCVCVSVCTYTCVFSQLEPGFSGAGAACSISQVPQALCLDTKHAVGLKMNLCRGNENDKGYFCFASIGIARLLLCTPYK